MSAQAVATVNLQVEPWPQCVLYNRHRLPAGWQSTANALEKTAHTVKDALLIVDDFKPAGSQTDVSKAHGNLTRILQGVADGTGRGRLGLVILAAAARGRPPPLARRPFGAARRV